MENKKNTRECKDDLFSSRYDQQQYDAAGKWRCNANTYTRGSIGGDYASSRAFEVLGDRERGDER